MLISVYFLHMHVKPDITRHKTTAEEYCISYTVTPPTSPRRPITEVDGIKSALITDISYLL